MTINWLVKHRKTYFKKLHTHYLNDYTHTCNIRSAHMKVFYFLSIMSCDIRIIFLLLLLSLLIEIREMCQI